MQGSRVRSINLEVLLSLAWPVVLARSSQAVIGFCDALMIAPLGEEALAAVTTGTINIFAVVILPMGVAFIVQSFAAQLKGRGDLLAARRYAWYGLCLAALSAIIAAVAVPLVEPLLAHLAYAPKVRAQMSEYLAIRLFAVGAVVATEVLGNWFGGLGNTRLHMVAGFLAMASNVFLNWVLIYGHWGAPALGVQGAALASLIASWLGLVFLAIVFARGWMMPAKLGPVRLRWREFRRMLRFGLPNGLNWFLEFAAVSLFINVMVADLGTPVLAAMMVVINVNSVSFMPAFGLSSSGAILAGQAIGRGRRDEVPAIVGLTMRVAACWQGGVGILYVAFPGAIMGWFAPPSAPTGELLRVGTVMLALSAAWQLFDAVAMTLSEALRAAGDTAWIMWTRLTVAWILFVPGAACSILVLGAGHVGAMLSLVGYLAVLAAAFAWRFRSGAWRKIDLTGAEAELA